MPETPSWQLPPPLPPPEVRAAYRAAAAQRSAPQRRAESVLHAALGGARPLPSGEVAEAGHIVSGVDSLLYGDKPVKQMRRSTRRMLFWTMAVPGAFFGLGAMVTGAFGLAFLAIPLLATYAAVRGGRTIFRLFAWPLRFTPIGWALRRRRQRQQAEQRLRERTAAAPPGLREVPLGADGRPDYFAVNPGVWTGDPAAFGGAGAGAGRQTASPPAPDSPAPAPPPAPAAPAPSAPPLPDPPAPPPPPAPAAPKSRRAGPPAAGAATGPATPGRPGHRPRWEDLFTELRGSGDAPPAPRPGPPAKRAPAPGAPRRPRSGGDRGVS